MINFEDIIDMGGYLVCHLITLSKTHDYFINQYIKETDITPGQYYMLMYLYYDGEATQSDIATACLMDRCGVSRAFKEFEEKGLIVREVNEKNKRSYKITLTDKAIETVKFLEEKEFEWENMICKELGIEKEDLSEILKNLALKSLYFNREKFFNDK